MLLLKVFLHCCNSIRFFFLIADILFSLHHVLTESFLRSDSPAVSGSAVMCAVFTSLASVVLG